MQAPAGGPPGVRTLGRKGDDGSHKACPPPASRGAGAAPRACDKRATKGRRQGPSPPHTPPPPQGWEMKEGRGGQRPPLPEDRAARWGGSGGRVRDGPHDRARRKHAPCKPQRGGHRGCERRVGRATTGATRQAPPAAEGQVPRLVPAPCLRRAYARGRTARAPPPPTPFSPTQPGKGQGQQGGGEGTWGGGRGQTEVPGGETGGERWGRKKKQRTKQTNAPREESEKAGTKTAANEGRPGQHGPARDAGEVPDHVGMGAPKGNPPPHCSLALCLRRACVMPATCVLQREDDKGDKVDHGSGTRTPPRGQRGRVGRQRREGAGRTTRPCPKGARAVQAPTGGPPGVRPQDR